MTNYKDPKFKQYSNGTRRDDKGFVTTFRLDYEMYLGSQLTPSGKINPVPNNHYLAFRYAVSEYRKRKRQGLEGGITIEDLENNIDNLEAVDTTLVDPTPGPEEICSYNDLVAKVLTALETKEKDRDLCRYFATIIYQLDGMDILNDDIRARLDKYLEDVDLDKVGKFDKDIAEALHFDVGAGSQSRKLVSVKKRLADRVRVLGITRMDIFGG